MAAELRQFGSQLDMFESSGGSPSVSDSPVRAIQPPFVKVTQSLTAEPVSRIIEDAGEELRFNRRNRVRTGKRWEDVAHLNETLKVKEVVKSNVWPKPDYKALIEAGMQPMIANIVKQVYDSVAVKPVVRGALDDVVLQRYITSLDRVERGLMAWANDPAALKSWVASNARIAGAMLGRTVNIGELAGGANTLLDHVYPGGYKPFRDELIVAGGNKLLGALQPGYDEIRKAMKAIEKGWPEKREAWEVQGFRVVENPPVMVEPHFSKAGEFLVSVENRSIQSCSSREAADAAVAQIGPFVLFDKRTMVGSFASEEEAVAAAKERTRRSKGQAIGEKGLSVLEAERVGVSRRMENEDVSAERVMLEFGLKGVNFGNWMKTPAARAEAQLHLNHAFDAFHDLAEIMNVPPKAIGLNGMLGLAIGAQGGGGALAHFVPGVNEINLTRTCGAGALGHEWAHALDHYYGVMAGLASEEKPFLTMHATLGATKRVGGRVVDGKYVSNEVPRFGDLRPEMVSAFKSVVEAMDKREQTPAEVRSGFDERLVRAQKNVDSWLKSIRRDFAGQEDAFDVLAARVRAGDVGDGRVALGRDSMITPVVAEIRDLYKAGHGRVYSIDNIKGLQAWVDQVDFQVKRIAADEGFAPQRVSTQFARNAMNLDKAKGGKPYWSTTLEKFARSFDAFISDELEAGQAKNGYLSHTGRADETVPMGDDRRVVNSAFRALVGEIQVRESDKGVALFSRSESTKEAYQRRVDELFSGAAANREGAIALDRSDMLDMLGLGKMPVHVTESKILAGLHNHGLTAEHWKKVPEWLSNPAIVFDSDTVSGRMVFVAPEMLNDKPIVLIVEPNAKINEIDVHLLVNAYDKTNGKMPVKRWVDERMTRYVDKTKSQQFLATSGLQLPGVLQSVIGSSRKIYTDGDLVKYRMNNNGLSSIESEDGVQKSILIPSRQLLPVSAMQMEIDRLRKTWLSMPPVTIVNKASDLPFAALPHTDGAYCDGHVYVVASNIKDVKQLQKVMAHECVMHHSLQEMLGNYGFAKLNHGIQTLKAKGDPVVCELADDIKARYGVLPAETETKEIVARAGEKCLDADGNVKVEFGFMKSVYAGAAGWLRDKGFKIPFTNTELQGIMHDAGKWIEQDRVRGWRNAGDGVVLGSLADNESAKAVTDDVVKVGAFTGKILNVTNDVVTQKKGLDGEVVKHDARLLSEVPKQGSVVKIAYPGGRGVVTGLGRGSGVER